MEHTLRDRVAWVAGATRGAGRGIALALGEAGATVYCTGRSSRAQGDRSKEGADPMDLAHRPETIEDTAEQVTARGGKGIAMVADHLDLAQIQRVADRIESEQGRLDLLVNSLWGGDAMVSWGTPFWEQTPEQGFRVVETVLRTHAQTSRCAVPLILKSDRGVVIEVTDGDFDGYRGSFYYDLSKALTSRLAYSLDAELAFKDVSAVALAVTPGFLRSEAMLELFGVSEENWRDGVEKDRHFAQSETPLFVGRAIAALAADPKIAARRGRVFSSGELAEDYDFDDADGRRPHWTRYFDETVRAIAAKGDAASDDERGLARARYFQVHRDPAQAELAETLAPFAGRS